MRFQDREGGCRGSGEDHGQDKRGSRNSRRYPEVRRRSSEAAGQRRNSKLIMVEAAC